VSERGWNDQHHREIIMTLNLKATAALAVLMAVSIAPVHAGSVKQICASKGVIANAVTIELSPGCVSSTKAVIGHDFIVKVREDGSAIEIIGAFKHRNPDARIGTADCMGSRSATFDVVGLSPGPIEVIENGESYGVITLAGSVAEQCLEHKWFRSKVRGPKLGIGG
jgi:hypothetical protein